MEGYSDEYRKVVEREIEDECRSGDPVFGLCDFKSFYSKSKGRGRARSHPKLVELVGYRVRYFLWANTPFDTIATEVYGHAHGDVEARLQRELRRL